MIFADTNILVYSVDRSEGIKCERAAALLANAALQQELVLSTQVLAEFYNTLVRRRMMTPADSLTALQIWSSNIVVPATGELVIEAARLQQRHRISLWDALVVQAALRAGCTTLFTEDLQHGMRFGDLEVVNPFSNAVHEAPATYLVEPAASSPAGVRAHRKTTRRAS